jgi:hypothetical protein
MAKSTPLYVGVDVHKESIAVAHATGGRADPPVFVGAIGTRQADIDKLILRLIRFRGHVPKGGYDVPHVPQQWWPAPSPAVL